MCVKRINIVLLVSASFFFLLSISHCSSKANFIFKSVPRYLNFQDAFLINHFIYLWLHWVFFAASGLSLVVVNRVSSCCGAQALGSQAQQLQFPGSRTQAEYLWYRCLVVLWHVRSSWTRNQDCVVYTGRWFLNSWSTQGNPRKFLTIHLCYSVTLA